MMQFKFLEEVFPSINLSLDVLSRDTLRYSMLLYQHQGVLFASPERIGNQDQELAHHQLSSFLGLLKSRNVDLGVTPEYVVPWSVLSDLLTNSDKWPADGKIWVLGMESINKGAITDFAAQWGEQVIFHFDERVLACNENYLNATVYVFRAKIEGNQRLIALVQFKTKHMGAWSDDLERNYMIPGTEIYVVRNNSTSVGLFTLICSEAMNLVQDLDATVRAKLMWDDMPYLILNPQINPGPTHKYFLDFRNTVFAAEKKEIVSLNWNNCSKVFKNNLIKEGASRSGIFMRSTDFNFDARRIKKNHNLGMYYFYYGKDRHAFLLDSKTQAFQIDNPPVHIIGGVGAQQFRNGPEVMAAFNLGQDYVWEELNKVSDGVEDYLKDYPCTNEFLLDPNSCVLEKERLVCLSSGEVPERADRTWANVNKLSSIRLSETTELNFRLTVPQDIKTESTVKRDYYIKAVEKLNNIILKDKTLYPVSMARYKADNILLGYCQQKDENGQKVIAHEYFRYNVVQENGDMVYATICYVPLGGKAAAKKVFSAVRGLFDNDSMSGARVVVYYESGNTYACICDPNPASIITTNNTSEESILS